MEQPYFIHSLFRDFDEFVDAVYEWELDFLQLEAGGFDAELMQVGTGSAHFGQVRFNRLIHQRGTSPRGIRTFAVLADPSFRLFWRGREITGDMIMKYPAGGEIDAVSKAGFEVFTVSFPDEMLTETGRFLGISSIQEYLSEADVFTCHTDRMREFRDALHGFNHAMKKGPLHIKDRSLLRKLEKEILRKLISSFPCTRSYSEKTTFRLRDRALNRALACMEESKDPPLSVQELCQLAGASERTLQYAFLERFGVSPKTYLQSLRLNRVRRELWSADPSLVRVLDVANSWGFWHMGQFASDYRRLFGELPSKTLGK